MNRICYFNKKPSCR